jgi:glycyl-tRNA synthetase
LAAQGIIVDLDQRRTVIRQQIQRLAAEVEGTPHEDPALLEEITNLVEQPTALRGEFDPAYLSLPKPVLITVMKKHQRYVPIIKDAGSPDVEPTHDFFGSGYLMPYFITVRNGGTQHAHIVKRGNESVLRARYADADFFFQADTSQPLESFLPRLDTLLFQEQLGSMLDKTRRLEQLATSIGKELQLSNQELDTIRRAAHLCKADLATQMVVEFTSLQGVMGREYALHAGEDEPVATAIYEHYLPRSAGDLVPTTPAGLVLGLANRLDSLMGLFAVGLAPSGSADPYGLRREALGLVTMLINTKTDYSLARGLDAAAHLLPQEVVVSRESITACLNFISRRLEGVLREWGLRHDVVRAVLAESGDNPHRSLESSQALQDWVERENWEPLLIAYARCKRIVRPILDQVRDYQVDPAAFVEEASRDLWAAYQQATQSLEADTDVDQVMTTLEQLTHSINAFFDTVLVMDENESLRQNRLALVYAISAIPDKVVDLSQIMGF